MATSCVVYIDQSVADRTPQPRKRGSVVGFIPDPFRKRRICFESKLERNHLLQFIASPNVIDVREQQKVEFFRGRKRAHHIFDILVQWKSLRTLAAAVKYREDCHQDLRDDLAAVADQVGDTFADRYAILTEEWIDQVQLSNAARIVSCGQDHDYAAQDAIRGYLASAGPKVTLAECDNWLGERNRGSRAAIALIQSGALGVENGELIRKSTPLRNLFTN